MTSMFVPEPVMSLAITPKKSKKGGGSDTADKFSKVPGIVTLPVVYFCYTPRCEPDDAQYGHDERFNVFSVSPTVFMAPKHVSVFVRLSPALLRRTPRFGYTPTMTVSKLSSVVWGSCTWRCTWSG